MTLYSPGSNSTLNVALPLLVFLMKQNESHLSSVAPPESLSRASTILLGLDSTGLAAGSNHPALI